MGQPKGGRGPRLGIIQLIFVIEKEPFKIENTKIIQISNDRRVYFLSNNNKSHSNQNSVVDVNNKHIVFGAFAEPIHGIYQAYICLPSPSLLPSFSHRIYFIYSAHHIFNQSINLQPSKSQKMKNFPTQPNPIQLIAMPCHMQPPKNANPMIQGSFGLEL